METGLRNRVAIVGGSSQGIGRAAAFGLAAEGSHVALCSRDAVALDRVADEIRRRYQVRVFTAAFDASDSVAIDPFVRDVHRNLERIDICITNAGGPPARKFLETTDEEWTQAFVLNLRSAAAFARSVIPHMQERRWGRIIAVSSITVREPQPDLVLSNAIRTGVMGLIRTLASDFGGDGITANNVAPGYTATERVKQLSAKRAASSGQSEREVERLWIDQIPLGRLGLPEEIADAIVWLASERASFVTGQTILVDGGMYKGL